jgi:hypothetical protein
MVVRPLRFQDGTLHPHALVPTIRFTVTGVSAFGMTRAQVLGDYLLLWIPGKRADSVAKLYMIAWKQGSITLVSYVFFINDHPSH